MKKIGPTKNINLNPWLLEDEYFVWLDMLMRDLLDRDRDEIRGDLLYADIRNV